MTLRELKEAYNRGIDRAILQGELVESLMQEFGRTKMRERELNSFMNQLKNEQLKLKEINRQNQVTDQMIQDKYTIREMYIVQNFKLTIE